MQIKQCEKDEHLNGELIEAENLQPERGSFAAQFLSDDFVRQISLLNHPKTSEKLKLIGFSWFSEQSLFTKS